MALPPLPGTRDGLSWPLEAIAARRRRRAILGIVLASAIAFAFVHLVAAVMAWQSRPLANAAVLAVVLGAIIMAIGLVWLVRQPSTRGDLAFHVDRLAGLEQRYGTAVEVDADRRDEAGAVVLALRRAGAADAEALDPARLVPLITRPLAVGLGALAMVSLAIALVPGRSGDVAGRNGLAAPSLPEPADIAETASEVARLIAADAETRDDPYLAAVARAIEERLTANTDLGALEQDLAQLLEHAADAYGVRPPEWLGTAGSNRLAGLQERLDRFAEEQARRDARRGGSPLMADLAYDDYGVDPEEMGIPPSRSVGNAAPQGEILEPDAQGERLAGGEPADGLRRMSDEEVQLAGAMPSGAALESGRGRSRAAGLGSETLEGDDAFGAIAFQPGEDMVVTATPEAGGRRIRVEVAPDAEAAGPDGAAGALGASAQGPDAQPQQRQYVPADRRAVTARYFARAPQ